MRRGGLGRGLSALIPGAAQEAGLARDPRRGRSNPNPRQPRTEFDEESLGRIGAFDQEVGVLQPVVVRRTKTGYELVAGERRLRAAASQAWRRFPAIIRDTRRHRRAPRRIDREHPPGRPVAARARRGIPSCWRSSARRRKRSPRVSAVSRPQVANTIRLLQLPPDVQHLLGEGRLTAGMVGRSSDSRTTMRRCRWACARRRGTLGPRGRGAGSHLQPGARACCGRRSRLEAGSGGRRTVRRSRRNPLGATPDASSDQDGEAARKDHRRVRLRGRSRADRRGDRGQRQGPHRVDLTLDQPSRLDGPS